MSTRTPRSTTSREAGERPKRWVRPSTLPAPEPKDGLKYRWVRTSTLGERDDKNMSARIREGYEPVPEAELTGLGIRSDLNSRFRGSVEVGGLVLCQIDADIARSREAVQNEQTAEQIVAVDSQLMRESNPRMPILRPERSTKITFGEE